MSDNGNPEQQVPQIPPVEVTCASCKKKFEHTAEYPVIVNQRNFSMAIWTHDNPVRCPHCLLPHVFVIGMVNAGWGLTPVQETQKERKQILIPPPGLKM